VFVGATERVIHNSVMYGTSYHTGVVTPVTAPWSQAAVNGLYFRLGGSTVSDPPRWYALMLEIDVPVSTISGGPGAGCWPRAGRRSGTARTC
jgi:hypothetical protein